MNADELTNLDTTIAEFIIPRLIAFRDRTDSYPDDLPNLDAWQAELTAMVNAWMTVSVQGEYADAGTRAGLRLFTDRLKDLWQ